jgi:putative endonuclease
MFITYILKSAKDGKLYIGSTGNLARRLREHENGSVRSTRHRRPLELVYKEEFATKEKTSKRERYFKGGGKARKMLDGLIKNMGV